MAVPILDVRVDWRGDGLNTITNDAFLSDTTGWSVGAGINAAGTSITRQASGGPMGGLPASQANTCGRLVTTGTSGSGMNFDLGATVFTAGRIYRLRVWLKSVSGTTSAKILIGSLGTGGDRASTSPTITTSWVAYQVDWTPSATRSDVEVNVTNGTAATMTADVCLVEVYEPLEDVTAYVKEASWTRGANFDGSVEGPGSASLVLQDDATQRFNPDGPGLGNLVKLNRQCLIRATYGNLVYGCFAGGIRRIIPAPSMAGTVTLLLEDRLWYIGRTTAALVTSNTRSIKAFRGYLLDDIGETAARRDLGEGAPEWAMPVTGADNEEAGGILDELNEAAGTVHFIRPHPAASVGYRYTTVARTVLQTGASVETWDDDLADLSGWDVNDETLVNRAEVTPSPRAAIGSQVVWQAGGLPLSIPAGASRTIWAGPFSDPTFNAALSYAATNTPTVTPTFFRRSAKIIITAGASASIVSALAVVGQPAPVATLETAVSEGPASQAIYGRYGFTRTSEYLSSVAEGQGLADWFTYRYPEPKARPSLSREGRFPSQLERDITDRIALTFPLLSLTDRNMYIRSFSTTVAEGGAVWRTAYGLEEAVLSETLFTLDGSALEGFDSFGEFAR